jgi:indole-3-glycerol phosphate synthase/phosphoribosylanthranilate isomerase
MLGDNKVCGLTRAEDARAAYEAGAIYGGLIFAKDSPRQLDEEKARLVMSGAPLKYAGVFRNNAIGDIVTIVAALNLRAVQLHGDEDQAFVTALRAELPERVQIWKAFSIKETLPARDWQHVDRYVFDNGNGGSGKRFDWSLLRGESLENVLLAGGLGADNCVEAAQLGCAGLDFNSGVERAPGIKDALKIASVFHTLKAY